MERGQGKTFQKNPTVFSMEIWRSIFATSTSICNCKGKSSQTAPLAIKNAKGFYCSKSLLRIIVGLFTELLIGSDLWRSLVQPPAWSRTTASARPGQLFEAQSWKPPRMEALQSFWIPVPTRHRILVRRFYYHVTALISFYCINI